MNSTLFASVNSEKCQILEPGYNLSSAPSLGSWGNQGPVMLMCPRPTADKGPQMGWGRPAPGSTSWLLARLCAHGSRPPQARGRASATVRQAPPSAYFATRGSGLSLEGLCVIAPHAAVGPDLASACHADLGGLQQEDAGCRDGQEGSSFSTCYAADWMPEFTCNTSAQIHNSPDGRCHRCPGFTDVASEA